MKKLRFCFFHYTNCLGINLLYYEENFIKINKITTKSFNYDSSMLMVLKIQNKLQHQMGLLSQ